MKHYIGIDLGGTNIVAGVVDENYNIIAKASTKTNCPRPEKEIADDMAKMALQAVANAGLTIDDIEWVTLTLPLTANTLQAQPKVLKMLYALLSEQASAAESLSTAKYMQAQTSQELKSVILLSK